MQMEQKVTIGNMRPTKDSKGFLFNLLVEFYDDLIAVGRVIVPGCSVRFDTIMPPAYSWGKGRGQFTPAFLCDPNVTESIVEALKGAGVDFNGNPDPGAGIRYSIVDSRKYFSES